MKIKRVEIQAFKSYIQRKDGTFDFMVNTPSGERKPANLISIYAPNGFGKTAFYDAVEYCITNNISRYVRGTRIRRQNERIGKNNNLPGEKQYILRNKNIDNIDPDLNTIIKIETTGESYRSQHSKPQNSSMDYKFNLNDTPDDRKFFRNVMLTQEAIDAFLREDSPADKYDKFIDNQVGDLTDIDDTRQKINRMLDEISRKCKELDKELASIKLDLEKIDVQKDVFTEANSLIKELEASGYNLPLIENPFSEVQKQQTDDRITSVKALISGQEKDQLSLDTSIKNFVVNLRVYRECYYERKRLENNLNNLSNTIKNKQEFEEKYSQVKAHRSKKETLSNNLKKVSDFLNQLPDFVEHKVKLSDLNKLITEQENKLSEADMVTESNNTSLKSCHQEQQNFIAEKQKLTNLQTNSSRAYQNISGLQSSIDEKSKLTTNEVKNQRELEYGIEVINGQITQIESFEVTQLISSHVVLDIRDDLNLLHESFLKETHDLTVLHNKNTKVQVDLSNIQQQSSSISELIRQGAAIVMQTQQSDCPLCQSKYPSFEKLKEQIESNPALKNMEKTLLQGKNNLGSSIAKSEALLAKLKLDYETLLKEVLRLFSGQLNKKRQLLADSQSKKNILELSEKKYNQELAVQSEITLFKKADELNIYLEKEISLIQKKIEKCKLDIENAEKIIVRSDETKKEIDKALALTLTKQQSLINSSQFQLLNIFLESKSVDDSSDIEEIRKQLSTLQQQNQEGLDNKVEVIKDLENRINKLNELIPIEYQKKSIMDVEAKKDTKEKELSELLPKLSAHEKAVLYLEIDSLINAEDWSLIEDKANDSLRDISANIEIKKQQLSDLELLSHFSNEALNFSNKLELQQDELHVKKKIKGLSSIKDELSLDLRNISQYLEYSIKQYFHTDLINQIYASIDPHPEFKKIQFNCEIPETGGKPELHIKLMNPENGSTIQPTLHFSSAQINVLSLSIFLAKALNVKDNEGKSVDCIFIDDPVQSMDSINALGLIDLFRNLSSKFDKQLIIATHDENFHQLLKKKMPTDVFCSKYLALESFGKVVEQ